MAIDNDANQTNKILLQNSAFQEGVAALSGSDTPSVKFYFTSYYSIKVLHIFNNFTLLHLTTLLSLISKQAFNKPTGRIFF